MVRSISKWTLDLLGWQIKGQYPEGLKQFVVIVMSHTSAWDFPLGLLVRAVVQADIRFVAKDSLFRSPFGWFFRWMGGYPVDRSKRSRYVDAVIDIFEKEENFVVTIAPEGTREKVDRLRTGFYYIALGGGVPIVMVRFDYGRREVVISKPFWPSGDKDRDFPYIIDFFKDAQGKYPDKGIDEKVKY